MKGFKNFILIASLLFLTGCEHKLSGITYIHRAVIEKSPETGVPSGLLPPVMTHEGFKLSQTGDGDLTCGSHSYTRYQRRGVTDPEGIPPIGDGYLRIDRTGTQLSIVLLSAQHCNQELTNCESLEGFEERARSILTVVSGHFHLRIKSIHAEKQSAVSDALCGSGK
ncbi:MAG: hypothetical protein AAB737_00615 [Patescibacteria group bacterium]